MKILLKLLLKLVVNIIIFFALTQLLIHTGHYDSICFILTVAVTGLNILVNVMIEN